MALVKIPNFVLVFLSYGMNVGVFSALSTLLNQIVLENYPVSFQIQNYYQICVISGDMFIIFTSNRCIFIFVKFYTSVLCFGNW